MSPSQRGTAAAEAFEEWRKAQELEQRARPQSLFDPPAEPKPESVAVRSVATTAGSAWMAHASKAIRAAAHVHPELTVDDVWPFVTEQVHDPRAMGAAMRQAARDGFLERIPGAYRTSARAETHSRPLAVWRSRLYGRAA